MQPTLWILLGWLPTQLLWKWSKALKMQNSRPRTGLKSSQQRSSQYSGIYPTWCRVGAVTITGNIISPTDGLHQTGLHWDYSHQDEWLITPSFNCPPNAYLRFDGYVFLGSEYGDHYYVKVSTDNGTSGLCSGMPPLKQVVGMNIHHPSLWI